VTTWTSRELDRIGQAEELQLATRRHQDGVSRHVTTWVVRAGGAIDAAYHAKYDRYGPRIVGSVPGSGARDVTVRLVKAAQGDQAS
jgi:hypothetical protein